MDSNTDEKSAQLLQDTVNSLTADQISGVNDGLRYYEECLMTTKDRRALLEHWIHVARRNDAFRDWLANQLETLEGPAAAAALQHLAAPPNYSARAPASKDHTIVGADYHTASVRRLTKITYTPRLCLAVILVLSISIVLLILSLALILEYATTNDSPNSNSSMVVVAENDTAIIGTYTSSQSILAINEVVLKGDDNHRCYVLAVPTSILKYHWMTLYEAHTNIEPSVDLLPIIDFIYVYLLNGSTLTNEICMGNVSNSPNATLYVFNDETQYDHYMQYYEAERPVYQFTMSVGGLGNMNCINDTFTAQASSYYFFVMLAPLEGTSCSVKTTAREKYINYKEYMADYKLCVVTSDHNCSVSLSINSNTDADETVTVIAYTEPNYSLGSKINHLNVVMQSNSAAASTDKTLLSPIVCWCLMGLGLFLLLLSGVVSALMVYSLSVERCSKGAKYYTSIPTVIN